LAIFAFLLFVFIAFFKMSELGLIPFVAKLVRNLFFDTPRKFQANYDKIDPLKVAIKRTKSSDQTQTIFEQKDKSYSKDKLDKINDSSLI
jgi:nicotinic acid mononucleotide adenylyltransferase